jgi:hypothetical protein
MLTLLVVERVCRVSELVFVSSIVCEWLAMRMTVIASIVALSAACGIESPPAVTESFGAVAPTPVPPALLPGNYEVVFAADAVCTSLPEAARTRTYTGSLGGSTIDLAGAIFASAPPEYPTMNFLYVRLVGDFASVYASDPPVWEFPTPDSDLLIEGAAEGTVRDNKAELPFDGSFSYCPASRHDEGFLLCSGDRITCRSHNHRLRLTRK